VEFWGYGLRWRAAGVVTWRHGDMKVWMLVTGVSTSLNGGIGLWEARYRCVDVVGLGVLGLRGALRPVRRCLRVDV